MDRIVGAEFWQDCGQGSWMHQKFCGEGNPLEVCELLGCRVAKGGGENCFVSFEKGRSGEDEISVWGRRLLVVWSKERRLGWCS